MVEKAQIISENTCTVMNRLFVEIWAIKAMLVSSETRNTLLKTRGKDILVR